MAKQPALYASAKKPTFPECSSSSKPHDDDGSDSEEMKANQGQTAFTL